MTTTSATHDADWLTARIRELEAIRQALWGDRDDPHVLSELTAIQQQLSAHRTELEASAST